MTRYLVSFEDGAMRFPEEELPDVVRDSLAVVHEARDAGVWVFGGGIVYPEASVVGTDGTVTNGYFREGKERLGGFAIIDVSSREEALAWAAKLAVACRCAQDVRELMPEPDV